MLFTSTINVFSTILLLLPFCLSLPGAIDRTPVQHLLLSETASPSQIASSPVKTGTITLVAREFVQPTASPLKPEDDTNSLGESESTPVTDTEGLDDITTLNPPTPTTTPFTPSTMETTTVVPAIATFSVESSGSIQLPSDAMNVLQQIVTEIGQWFGGKPSRRRR